MRHLFTTEVSQELKEGIRYYLYISLWILDRLKHIHELSEKGFAENLKADLLEHDITRRVMTSISKKNAAEIFKIFKIKDPDCDKDSDGMLKDRA